jgi:hypothetical protein
VRAERQLLTRSPPHRPTTCCRFPGQELAQPGARKQPARPQEITHHERETGGRGAYLNPTPVTLGD